MTTHFTDDEIDALGERLRHGITDAGREIYREYRRVLHRLRRDLEAELRLLAPDAEPSALKR